MTKTKVYFWLKIDKKFFDNLFIKRLKNISGGYAMMVIYIRLMLESLDSDCILYYEGYFNNLKEELALKLDVSVDDMDMTLSYFTRCGLIQIDEEQNAEMTQAKALIKSETNWASYKREQRERAKMENSQKSLTMSNPCPTELELELDKDIDILQQGQNSPKNENPFFKKLKEIFGEMSVSGTIVEETQNLIKEHGENLVLLALDETILNAGNSIKYTRAILKNWKRLGLKTTEQVKKHIEQHESNRRKKAGTNKTDGVAFQDLGKSEDLGF